MKYISAPITAPPLTNISRPCLPSPCGNSECGEYDGHVAICNPCIGEDAIYNPACRPECLTDADCSFNKACLNQACTDPCPGSCGINAFCTVVLHTPACSCPEGFIGNPFEQCVLNRKYLHSKLIIFYADVCFLISKLPRSQKNLARL